MWSPSPCMKKGFPKNPSVQIPPEFGILRNSDYTEFRFSRKFREFMDSHGIYKEPHDDPIHGTSIEF